MIEPRNHSKHDEKAVLYKDYYKKRGYKYGYEGNPKSVRKSY